MRSASVEHILRDIETLSEEELLAIDRRLAVRLREEEWSRPRIQFQAMDTLEFLGVARYQGQATGEGLSCNEQVIGADGLALSFQVHANPRGRFRRCPVQWEFDDGRDELLNFLTLFGRVSGFFYPQNSSYTVTVETAQSVGAS